MRLSIKLNNKLSLRDNMILAQRAEEAGLDGIWISEYSDRDGVTQMASLASATTRIPIGSSIIPIYTRSAALLAMSVAALSELAPGRICLGLGVSTDAIVQGWHGTKRDSPLSSMRENVQTIRSILTGQKTDFTGKVVSSHGFRYLTPEHLSSSRIGVAALGPGMCKLAGQIADAALLNYVPAEGIQHVRDLVESSDSQHTTDLIADVRVAMCEGSDETTRRADARRMLASYGRVPAYNAHFERIGYESEARLLSEAWAADDGAAASQAVSDGMLDALMVVGGEDRIANHLRALSESGLDEATIYPLPHGDEKQELNEIIDLLARLRDAVKSPSK